MLYRRFSLMTAFLVLLVAPTLGAAKPHHRAHHARHSAKSRVAQSVTVWVNTDSGVYHFAGQRWYGTTKEGEYMSENAARAAGYRATDNGQ